jgi:hypothetical protein
MKISNIIRLTLLAAVIFLHASVTKAQSLSFGIRGGVANSTLLGIDSAKLKMGIRARANGATQQIFFTRKEAQISKGH